MFMRIFEGTIGLEIKDIRKHMSFLLVINFVGQDRTIHFPGKWHGSRSSSEKQACSNAVFHRIPTRSLA